MIKNKYKNMKGFSLTEFVVSVMLLSIMATAFVGLITHSFTQVFTSGNKSKALDKAQENVEVQMALGTATDSSNLIIQYDAAIGVAPLTVGGEIIQESVVFDGQTIRLTSFVVKH